MKDKRLIPVDEIFAKDMANEEFRSAVEAGVNKMASAVAVCKEREEYGWTQQELADKAGLPQSTVARIENGSNTSMDTMSKITNAFGKDLTLSFS